MRLLRRIPVGALALGVLWAAGCSVPPMTQTTPPPPTAAREANAARPVTPSATAPGVAPVDSAPSPAALAVLSTIPEPLTPAERVPPPTRQGMPVLPGTSTGAGAVALRSITGDTLSTAERAMADSAMKAAVDSSALLSPADTSGVPVPEPTPVLGEHPPESAGPTPAAGDTNASPAPTGAAAPPVAAGAAAGTAAGAAATPSGTCWRIQVVAPRDHPTALRKRAAAESLLLLPMVVEHEGSLWKIRSKECFDRATADRLKSRAIDSGFDGSFLFESHR